MGSAVFSAERFYAFGLCRTENTCDKEMPVLDELGKTPNNGENYGDSNHDPQM